VVCEDVLGTPYAVNELSHASFPGCFPVFSMPPGLLSASYPYFSGMCRD
jgi:hypothetical protein